MRVFFLTEVIFSEILISKQNNPNLVCTSYIFLSKYAHITLLHIFHHNIYIFIQNIFNMHTEIHILILLYIQLQLQYVTSESNKDKTGVGITIIILLCSFCFLLIYVLRVLKVFFKRKRYCLGDETRDIVP